MRLRHGTSENPGSHPTLLPRFHAPWSPGPIPTGWPEDCSRGGPWWADARCGWGPIAAAASGCLTNQYEISRDELARLAALEPNERAERVRVVQQTHWNEDEYGEPPQLDEGRERARDHGGSVHVHVHGGYHHHGHGTTRVIGRAHAPRTVARPRVGSAPGPNPTGPTRHVPASPTRGVGTPKPAAPNVGKAASGSRVPATPSRSAKSSGGSGGGNLLSGGGGGGGGDAAAAVVVAVAVVAVATTAMVVVAPVEGRRYDGWLSLDQEQPVLMLERGGGAYWTPLSSITPADVESVRHAVVVDQGTTKRLGRAPLTRDGLAYTLEMGAATPSTRDGLGDWAYQARVALGGFVTQEVGLLGGGQFSAGDQDGVLFNGRVFIEGQLLPLSVGRLHAGGYVETGAVLLLHDRPGATDNGGGWYPGAGALVQVDVSTRLALTLRGGASWLPTFDGAARESRAWAPEIAVGLAVY